MIRTIFIVLCFLLLCIICLAIIVYVSKENLKYSNGVCIATGRDRLYSIDYEFVKFKESFKLKNIYDVFDYSIISEENNSIIIEVLGIVKYAQKGSRVQYQFTYVNDNLIKKTLKKYHSFPYVGIYDAKMDEFLFKKAGAKPIKML